jgi:hypothetical protein
MGSPRISLYGHEIPHSKRVARCLNRIFKSLNTLGVRFKQRGTREDPLRGGCGMGVCVPSPLASLENKAHLHLTSYILQQNQKLDGRLA